MKILKRINGFGEVFDTENIQQSTMSSEKPNLDKSLQRHHHSTDLAFLRQFFPEDHRIFIRFGESFYYLV